MGMVLESIFFIKDLWLWSYWLQNCSKNDKVLWKGSQPFLKISAEEERYKIC